jgi:hypothetical protein
MIVHHVRKPTNFLFNVLSGGYCSEYQAAALFDDPLVNTFGAFHTYCGLNNNQTVGQFVDDLKTSITNGLAVRGLCGNNYEDDGATLMDNLKSLLRAPDASPLSHGKEHTDDFPESFHVAQKLWKDIGAPLHAGDMGIFSVAYVRGVSTKYVPFANIASATLRSLWCACMQSLFVFWGSTEEICKQPNHVYASSSVFIMFKKIEKPPHVNCGL